MSVAGVEKEGREIPFREGQVYFVGYPIYSSTPRRGVTRALRQDAAVQDVQEFPSGEQASTTLYKFTEGRSYLGIKLDLDSRRGKGNLFLQNLLNGTDPALEGAMPNGARLKVYAVATLPSGEEVIWSFDSTDRSISMLRLEGDDRALMTSFPDRILPERKGYNILVPEIPIHMQTSLPHAWTNWDLFAVDSSLTLGTIHEMYVQTDIDITGHEGRRRAAFEYSSYTPVGFFNPPHAPKQQVV